MKVYDLSLLPTVVNVRVPDARTYTSDPQQAVVVEISVDWSRIAKQLAPKAARSKSSRSQVMGGAVKVKVLERLGGAA